MATTRGLKMIAMFSLALCTACGILSGIVITSDIPEQPPYRRLTVFAAASLTEAFTEIGEEFESVYPRTEVVVSFAGSQQLAQQLSQGAPADIFASADEQQMENAILTGRVARGSQGPFIQNHLRLIMPDENPGNIQELSDLSAPGLRLILADRAVPVGGYSLEFLERTSQNEGYGFEFYESVMNNVVSYEESVRAVLSKIILGEADAGIVYTSDVLGANISMIDIPQELNITASYFIAPLNDSLYPDLAGKFVDYVLSPAGQEILSRNGFSQNGKHD